VFLFTLVFYFLVYRGYVGIHSSGFRDFLLKPELLRSIVDSGFEHPSEGNLLLCSSDFRSFYFSIVFNVQVLLLLRDLC
jgi:hypothetical protein